MKAGLIGSGTISSQYLRNLRGCEGVDVVARADIDLDRAEVFGVPMACSVEGLLGGPEIDLVVNLTVPTAHAQVSLAAVAAGTQVYGEKPLAVRREDGDVILRAAKKKGVTVGCAPDTGRHIILRTTCERPAALLAVQAPGSR